MATVALVITSEVLGEISAGFEIDEVSAGYLVQWAMANFTPPDDENGIPPEKTPANCLKALATSIAGEKLKAAEAWLQKIAAEDAASKAPKLTAVPL